MADRTLTVTAKGEAHQAGLADTIPGSVAAGTVCVVMADGLTNDDLLRALGLATDVARRDPKRINGV
jgi:hypothetical protein